MTAGSVAEQLRLLPDYLGGHMFLTLIALAVGIVICVPLGLVISRVRWLQWPTLAIVGVLQTIPGLALLALMVPLLGTIGVVPALLALIVYSFLPVLRNTVTGITGIDSSVVEAARGIGMTDLQMLRLVELPLALPVIVAGVRTAAVWVVGTATLATPVGATSLGNYVFSGLQTQNVAAILVGCVAAATLAIVLDQLIRLMEVATSRRSRRLAIVALNGRIVGAQDSSQRRCNRE
jgi:osmoprotectant transport system permease protein